MARMVVKNDEAFVRFKLSHQSRNGTIYYMSLVRMLRTTALIVKFFLGQSIVI
jgi:hypothetical protein